MEASSVLIGGTSAVTSTRVSTEPTFSAKFRTDDLVGRKVDVFDCRGREAGLLNSDGVDTGLQGLKSPELPLSLEVAVTVSPVFWLRAVTLGLRRWSSIASGVGDVADD